MTSTNFEIRWDTVGAGGDDIGSSASYILRDTTGNVGVGTSTSTNFALGAGYRQGVFDRFIDFSFFAQNNSIVATATAVAGTTVTCTTSAFSEGDLVALVQDLGESQVSAIGRLATVGVGSMAVDAWTNGGVAPVIDGTNDYVYKLSGTSANFGTMTASTVQTSIVGMEVSTDADAGYVVQVAADGEFRDGSTEIAPVADGAVSAGEEEFGARSSDVTLVGSTFDSADTELTTSFQDVADTASSAYEDRSFLTLKGAIDGTTAEGSYAQALTFVVSVTY